MVQPYIGRTLLLPNGQILFAAQTNAIYAYTYYGCPAASSRPVIPGCFMLHSAALHIFTAGPTAEWIVTGCGYGDDAALATNDPLVRIRNKATGHVVYCRTFDHKQYDGGGDWKLGSA